jgi:hypothetical protein
MAFTGKNIIPIVDGGAGLGSATKGWGGAFITNVTASSATQGGKLVLSADDGAVMASGHRLGVIEFKGAEDTSSTLTIGARIEALADATWSASENGASLKMYTTDANASESLVLTLDSDKLATFTGGIDLATSTGISINGTDILTDSSGTATLSNIDALDATTIATFETAMEANLDTMASQFTSAASLATIGTITTGVWQGTAVASAYLDADTAHLTTDQTFSGRKTFSAATTTFTSATADSPTIKVLNTTDDDQASQLIFEKLRDDDAVASGQNLGEIWFRGQDGSQNTEDYAYIVGEIDVSTNGQESGQLLFGVAGHDGSNRTGMILTGGSEASEVDVTVGLGANSVVTIPGDIDLAGDIDVDGTLETDALTINGTNVITGSLISTLGTISAGVWNGTAIGGNYVAATQPNIESIGTDGDTLDILGDSLSMQNSSSTTPLIQLQNTTDDAFGPRFTMINQRGGSAGADGDEVGKINFIGFDDQGTPATQTYTRILGQIHDATSGEESGKLSLQVANHDGGIGSGLILTGGSENNEIDVTLGLGASSVVTIPGDIDLAGDVDVDGTLETDALTVGGVSFTPSTTRQLASYNYKADQDTTKTYVSLADADSEGTTTTPVKMPFTAPVAGKLLKVFLKSNKNLNSHTLTWRLETQAIGVVFSTGPTVVGTQTGAGCTNSSLTTYDFTSVSSNAIAAGDTVFLSLQSDTDFGSNVIYYITCLWEWDLS